MAETILHWLKEFALTFVPLFIVIDPLGNLPFIISFSEDRPKYERNKMTEASFGPRLSDACGQRVLRISSGVGDCLKR
ncbi:MAG: MarC family protein, partial [Dehalococcoidia bacterium]